MPFTLILRSSRIDGHSTVIYGYATEAEAKAAGAVLGVNALTICDCGETSFKVGIAYSPDTGNNFIRLLECVACGHQMPATHRADSGLAPSFLEPGQVSSMLGRRAKGSWD